MASPETGKGVGINHTRLKSDLILLFVAVVWGSGFISQRVVANRLDPFLFNGLRFLIGAGLVLMVMRFKVRIERRNLPYVALAGGLLFVASAFQQIGLKTTTVGNASFITGLYVIFVPLILSLLGRHRIPALAWLAVLLAAIGTALLSLQAQLRFAPGDLLELVGAVFWALHVILVGWLSRRMDSFPFAFGQFLVCGVLDMATGLVLAPGGLAAVPGVWTALLYSGVFSVGLGYTLQVVGQKHAPAVDAAIILNMEAVFGALFGVLLLQEMLALQQIAGCVLIFTAMLLAQFAPDRQVSPDRKS
jgi:drug/metabolite transporter (DMT)-like permease